MDCACVTVDIDEHATMLQEKTVTARKAHACCECHGEINPGEQYYREKTVFDGSIDTYKTCLDCLDIRRAFMCNGWFWGDVLEALNEFMVECGDDISESVLAELRPGARGVVCDMIEARWEP